jgi:hypothetical protein
MKTVHITSNPIPQNINENALKMLVNQLTSKCYPVFGMRLITILMGVELPIM